MDPISFEVFGTPQPAGSKRAFGFKRHDGSVGATVVDDNRKSSPWKTLVSETAARAYSGPLLDGPLSVEFIFEIPRPQGHFGKRGLLPSAPAYPTVRPDALKLARAVEDALSKVLYHDDSQIVHELLVKRYGERARLLVTVQRPPGHCAGADGRSPLFPKCPCDTGASALSRSPQEQPSLISEEASR